MNTDSYFISCKTHFCQDYALATERQLVISDGCSSAKHTDVGARLFCWSYYQVCNKPFKSFNLLFEVANRVDAQRLGLRLPKESAYATLIGVDLINGVSISMCGDGVVAYVIGRNLIVKSFISPNNTPYYPAYMVDELVNNQWVRENGDNRVIPTNVINDELETALENETLSMIAIFSDGVSSIDGMSEIDVVSELCNFKTTNGSFVERRVKRFLKDKTFHDDISMAAVIF